MRAVPAAVPSAASLPTLDVKEPFGLTLEHWPVTAGVPFPQGRVRDVAGLRLTDGSAALPVQARVLSRWPDGSTRWALLDWQVDLQSGQTRRFRVESGVPGRAPMRGAGIALKVHELNDRVEVDTGPLQFAVPKTRLALFENVRLNGLPLSPGPSIPFFNLDGKRIEALAPTSVKVAEAGPPLCGALRLRHPRRCLRQPALPTRLPQLRAA